MPDAAHSGAPKPLKSDATVGPPTLDHHRAAAIREAADEQDGAAGSVTAAGPPAPAGVRRRVLANRRNGCRSSGPITGAGKERSRRNSIKQGILANALPVRELIGEEKEVFDALLAGLHEDLRPVTQLETTLVEQLASDVIRLRRIQEIESAVLSNTDTVVPVWRGESLDQLQRFALAIEQVLQALRKGVPFALPEGDVGAVAAFLMRRAKAHRARQAAPRPPAVERALEGEVTGLLRGQHMLSSAQLCRWRRWLEHVSEDLDRTVRDQVHHEQVRAEQIEQRGLELVRKLPSLQPLMKYDSHRRIGITRTLRTLRELQELRRLIHP